MKINPNDPINPVYDQPNINPANGGLTKREYFAVMALQGLSSTINGCTVEDDCVLAVKYADALIIELNK